jgi:Ca-activated chloride channel family protein
MKRAGILLSLLLVVLASFGVASAQDTCAPCPPDAQCILPECPRPVTPGVFTNPQWLRVDHHRVDVDIENQVATTNVDLEFVNEGDGLAEGTFLFPLPSEAAVEELIMYIDGVPIEAKILPADEARAIYDEIVRQYRDPALLEYVGSQAIQANVFPIPPGESRRITITYSQVLEVDNGLLHYVYPYDVTSLLSSRRVDQASISVNVTGSDEISNIYSPTHDIAISRSDDDTGFRAGWEHSNYAANDDFSLYFGLANDEISVNLLSYRESANEDGFFMLMVQPPVELEEDRIQPRDIIIVLDQSGSMEGDKWTQAQEAATYILENLNRRDRFNVILFSTGWRLFSDRFEAPDAADEAIDWINGMIAEGGTDINGALTTAMDMTDRERDTAILFLTDGLPTEGVVETADILDNIKDAAPSNVRLFSFGVGNDVDTFLIDTLVREFNGTSSYVRPNERIDEEVASLYNKIGAPVLTDVEIDFGGVRTDTLYPVQPLPDLFAGTQLTIVGRYRDGMDDAEIVLSGRIDGERVEYVYDGLTFRERSGGEPFVARLWATRRIGDLLNTIRLNGENAELVDSIVNLSVRYGIITPYTSFLIEEDDILTQTGREEAQTRLAQQAQSLSSNASGAAAVDAADQFGGFAAAEAPAPMLMPTNGVGGGGMVMDEAEADGTLSAGEPVNPIQTVGVKTFILRDGVWTDTTFQPDTMETEKVEFLSDAYFALLSEKPEIGPYLAIGERVIVVLDGTAYEVTVTEQ